jgi:uncharacterized protein YbcC (UPF0753/DUF2309 family)
MSTQVVMQSKTRNATKKEIARELYKMYHTLERTDLIHKFCEELLITENSARTHLSWCAKELNASLNKPYITRKIDNTKLKKEKAYSLFKSHTGIERKAMIQLFQSKLNISENSAATHCSLSAKRFSEEFGAKVPHKSIA